MSASMHRIADIHALSVAFMLLFMTFSVLQSMGSSILPATVAFQSLGSLYGSFAFFNLFAGAAVVQRIGCRAALFFGSLPYTAFAIANVAALNHSSSEWQQIAILIPFAILVGLGASVLWAAQGVYVTSCARKEHIGKYTGRFFVIFWFASILGPMATGLLLHIQLDTIIVFGILACVGFTGTIVLGYLWAFRPEPSNPPAEIEVVNHPQQLGLTSKLLSTFKMMFQPSMYLLMPLYFSTSIEQAFSSGSLLLFIQPKDSPDALVQKLALQTVFGISLASSSFLVGGFTDRFGSRPLMAVDLVLHVAAMTTLWIFRPVNDFYLLVPCAVVLAASDGILMSQIFKLLGILFPARSEIAVAFAAYKFHQSFGTGVMFAISDVFLDTEGIPNMKLWTCLVGAMIAFASAGVYGVTTVREDQLVADSGPDENSPLLESRTEAVQERALPQNEREKLRLNNRIGDVIVMAAAFFFIFSAFMVVQGLATSVLPKLVAFRVLGALYFSFAFSNLFLAAPIGILRLSLFLAPLTYSAFNLGTIFALESDNNTTQLAILVPSALLNGVGASVLWTAQSVYITKCSCKDSMGRYSGIFYAFLYSANLVGPILSSLVLNWNVSKIDLFKILLVSGSLGPLLLVYLQFRPPPNNEYDISLEGNHGSDVSTDPELSRSPSVRPGYFHTLAITVSREILFLAPISYFGSFQMAFNGGSIPLFIDTGDTQRDLTVKLYVVACMGAVSTVTSGLIGRVTDAFGPRRILVVVCILYLITITIFAWNGARNNIPILIFVSAMFSACSCTIGNQMCKIMGVLFKGNATAFAAQRFHSSIGTAAAFLLSSLMLDSYGFPNLKIWATLLLVLLHIGALGAIHVASAAGI